MRQIYSINFNKKYNSITEFCNAINAINADVRVIKKIIKNNDNNIITYKNHSFKVLEKKLSVSTIIKKTDFKKYMINNTLNINLILDEWKKRINENNDNDEYINFFNFLKNEIEKNGNFFNYKKTCFLWKKYKAIENDNNLWFCDTETCFTADIPKKFLFYDQKKFKNWDDINEIEKNLNVKDDDVNAGIRGFFKNNPKIKPYAWAFTFRHFKSNKVITLNYNDGINYYDNINKYQRHWYHNLKYDGYYIWNALIDELNYTIHNYTNKDEFINDTRFTNQKQKNRSISVLLDESKIYKIIIINNLGIKIDIECSYLKLPFSISNLGNFLNIPKKDLNYLAPRDKNYMFNNKNENDYIDTDTLIISSYYKKIKETFFKVFKKPLEFALTISSTAMNMLIDVIGKNEYKKLFGWHYTKNDEIFEKMKKEYLNDNKFFASEKFNNFISEKIKNKKINLEKFKYSMIKKIKNWENPLLLKPNEYEYLSNFYNGGYSNYNINFVGKKYTNINSLDIISSYSSNWINYKMPYGKPIYNCKCDNINNNTSEHFKLYELEILKDIKIIEGKENMIPLIHYFFENDKEVKAIDYNPYIQFGKYYLSQYMIVIFFTLFKPENDDFRLKKTMCFEHKIIKGFVDYVKLWKNEKEKPNLKETDRCYYELCKLFLNAPTGKFGQKVVTEKFILLKNKDGVITKEKINDYTDVADAKKYCFFPVIIATCDIGRLRVLSLIEKIGWDNWHNTDTDSVKVKLPEKLKPWNNPTYHNLISDKIETIYNSGKWENDKWVYTTNEFGKWSLEWTADKYMTVAKKKYIYRVNNKNNVICAGAPPKVKENLNFRNFFAGYEPDFNNKNKIDYLNGLPVILPTTFKIKNVFKSKIMISLYNRHLLHSYYIDNLQRLNAIYEKNKLKYSKEYLLTNNKDVINELGDGVYN